MGYWFIAGYVVLVGVATFLTKTSLQTIGPYQLNFLMAIGMMAITAPALIMSHESVKIPLQKLPSGFLIGLMMALGSVLYVLSLNKLPVSVASVLAASYVGVVVVLSWAFLDERFDAVKIIGLVLTFAGALLLTFKS